MQSRFLLRPSVELNDRLLGIIGRAQTRYQVEVHAFAFLSNHYHMLLTPADARELARFMNYLNSNIAREAGQLYKWREKFWSRRYDAIVVADEKSQMARLRYILAHGCKEGLVARPADWPGVHCAEALTTGKPLVGTWLDRTAEYKARRRNEHVAPSEFRITYPVTLTPLPCCAHLTPEAYRARCAALVADIERETAAKNAKCRQKPLGRETILLQHPHDTPRQKKRSIAPLVHAATQQVRKRFIVAYRRFVDAFRAAAEKLRSGHRDVVFPPGAFPPPPPFSPTTPDEWALTAGNTDPPALPMMSRETS